MPTTLDESGSFVHSPGSDVELKRVESALAVLATENLKLEERLENVALMVDERGWTPLYEYGGDGGLSLYQVKQISLQLRELVVGNPFFIQGFRLRHAYVHGGGVDFSTGNAKSALTAAVKAKIAEPRNQRYVFGATASIKLEKAAFTDSIIITLIDDLKKTVRQNIPIREITADFRNPDNSEEIWAYRRVWYKNPTAPEGQRQMMVRWYYTDNYEGVRLPNMPVLGVTQPEPVDITATIVAKSFNEQVGWAWGVPDALPVIAWARLYRDFLQSGYIMSRALARIAYKVTSNSLKGAQNAQAEVTLPGQAGGTAVEGSGNALQVMSSAGKGYDFESGRPLAAAVAAGFGVSLTALLGDTGSSAGPGAGVASIFDGTARATASVRRAEWDDYYERVIARLGNTRTFRSTWHDLNDDTIQRMLQAWVLFNNSGLFKPEIAQAGFASAMGVAEPGPIPEGYMIPNNSNSLDRLDVDTDGNPVNTPAAGDQQTPPSKPSSATGQGKSTGNGKQPNDHSTDEK